MTQQLKCFPYLAPTLSGFINDCWDKATDSCHSSWRHGQMSHNKMREYYFPPHEQSNLTSHLPVRLLRISLKLLFGPDVNLFYSKSSLQKKITVSNLTIFSPLQWCLIQLNSRERHYLWQLSPCALVFPAEVERRQWQTDLRASAMSSSSVKRDGRSGGARRGHLGEEEQEKRQGGGVEGGVRGGQREGERAGETLWGVHEWLEHKERARGAGETSQSRQGVSLSRVSCCCVMGFSVVLLSILLASLSCCRGAVITGVRWSTSEGSVCLGSNLLGVGGGEGFELMLKVTFFFLGPAMRYIWVVKYDL